MQWNMWETGLTSTAHTLQRVWKSFPKICQCHPINNVICINVQIQIYVGEEGQTTLNSQNDQHRKQEKNQKSKPTVLMETEVQHCLSWIHMLQVILYVFRTICTHRQINIYYFLQKKVYSFHHFPRDQQSRKYSELGLWRTEGKHKVCLFIPLLGLLRVVCFLKLGSQNRHCRLNKVRSRHQEG